MKRLLTKPALLGFTLIELIIVIVILGILVAAAIPKYKDLQFESKVSSTFGSLSSLRSGTSIFIAKDSSHAPPAIYLNAGTADNPTTGSECDGNAANGCTGGVAGVSGSVEFFPKYVQKVPSNEVLGEFGGNSTNASKVRVHSTGGIMDNSGSPMLGTADCATRAGAGAAGNTQYGMVTETTGWFYVTEPTTGSGGGGGEGFAWGINIGDAVPGGACFWEK